MSLLEREFEYKPKWTSIVLCAGFFGVTAIVLGTKAAANDQGLIINGVIKLEPASATAVYWVLTGCSVGFVAVAAFMVWHRLAYRQRLAFGPTGLTVPVSRWSREETEIEYRDIRDLSTSTISGQSFLCVTHVYGKYTITASMLASKTAFEEFCQMLAANVQESQLREERRFKSDAAVDRGNS